MARRVATFSGLKLLGWCVMTNHFHLLVYLPVRENIDEKETLRRYGVLKGRGAAEGMAAEIASWRLSRESGERRAAEWFSRQQRRMYNVGNFMKILKQWFTEEYNRRHAHCGTLWESAYYDRIVAPKERDMARCLGYIHLNPIRAAATNRFDSYVWSSYSAFKKGDPDATGGMHFVYGDDATDSEISEMHESLLESLLEEEKKRRADEIARKRVAGYETPSDPLTTEAMIAQRIRLVKEMQKEAMALRAASEVAMHRDERRKLREKEILALLAENPDMDVPSIAERLLIGKSMTYRIIREMKRKGLLK